LRFASFAVTTLVVGRPVPQDRKKSYAAAGRAMGMSYRRAWMLVDELNGLFREPVIMKQTGGIRGGGAALTMLGRDVVMRYRRIERTLADAAASDLESLRASGGVNKICKT